MSRNFTRNRGTPISPSLSRRLFFFGCDNIIALEVYNGQGEEVERTFWPSINFLYPCVTDKGVCFIWIWFAFIRKNRQVLLY